MTLPPSLRRKQGSPIQNKPESVDNYPTNKDVPSTLRRKESKVPESPQVNDEKINSRYTPEQEKIMRDLIQVAAGKGESGLFVNPITALPVIGNEILSFFGEGIPNLPRKIIDTIGSLVGIDPSSKNERENTARLIGELSGVHPIELAKMVSHVPDLAKYLTKLPKDLYRKFISKTVPQIPETTQIADKYGLRQFKGLEKENIPENAIVSKEKLSQASEELHQTSHQAIDKILDSKLPLREARKEGVDLKELYNSEFRNAEEAASNIKKPVDITNVIDYLNSEINKVKKSAPSLSNQDKIKLSILKREKNSLTKKQTDPKIKLLDSRGEPLIEVSNKRIQKKISGKQSIDQYRNFNENVSNIYRKPEFSGSEEIAKNTYEGIKKEWMKAIENSDPLTGKYLSKGNKIYHESSKINQVENILSTVFEESLNPKKLDKILHSRRQGAFLERNLGKEALSDLKNIAKYNLMAEKQLFSKLKNPETLLQMVGSLSPLKAILLFGTHASTGGLYSTYKIGKGVISRIKGNLLLSPKTSDAYSKFVESAAKGSIKDFEKASSYLSTVVNEEYGDEKKLIESSK